MNIEQEAEYEEPIRGGACAACRICDTAAEPRSRKPEPRREAPAEERTELPAPVDPYEEVTIMVKLKADPVLQDLRAGDEGVNEEAAKLRLAQDAVIAGINGVKKGEPIEPLYRYALLFNGFCFRDEYRPILR